MTITGTGELTILLAEDNDGHAFLLSDSIKRAGIENEILRFKDGQEALDYVSGKGADLHGAAGNYCLVLDIRMPRLDGIEVLRLIKSDPGLKAMPVIIITSSDDPKEIQLCGELGCDTYLNKPVSPEKFLEAVKKLGLEVKIREKPGLGA